MFSRFRAPPKRSFCDFQIDVQRLCYWVISLCLVLSAVESSRKILRRLSSVFYLVGRLLSAFAGINLGTIPSD